MSSGGGNDESLPGAEKKKKSSSTPRSNNYRRTSRSKSMDMLSSGEVIDQQEHHHQHGDGSNSARRDHTRRNKKKPRRRSFVTPGRLSDMTVDDWRAEGILSGGASYSLIHMRSEQAISLRSGGGPSIRNINSVTASSASAAAASTSTTNSTAIAKSNSDDTSATTATLHAANGVVAFAGDDDSAAVAGGAAASAVAPRQQPQKPTYIMSMMDDLGWSLGALETPPAATATSTTTADATATTTTPGGGGAGSACCSVPTHKLEQWAIFIHEQLTRESRGFHNVAHVFEISAGAAPIQLLAALFRNILSHYIDGDVIVMEQQQQQDKQPTTQHELLKGVLVPNEVKLQQDLDGHPRDAMVLHMFGYAAGQDLTAVCGLHKSFDVFLSAICACRLLEGHLSLKHMARLCTCLEATIPFRKSTAPAVEGGEPKQPLQVLHERLVECNTKFDLQMTEEEMVETVQLGADLLNRSVGNMVTEDLAEFLDHTWRLLPEQNAALRQRALYTVADYYKALHKMVQMLQTMEPESVYASFRGLPDVNETTGFRQSLERNLAVAIRYMRARLFSAALVSALACLTGGDDAPKSFFYGDVPTMNEDSDRLGYGLAASLAASSCSTKQQKKVPSTASLDTTTSTMTSDAMRSSGTLSAASAASAAAAECTTITAPIACKDARVNGGGGGTYHVQVYDILRGRGMTETGWDTSNAPFAAFLYQQLGDEIQTAALAEACPVPMAQSDAEDFLRRVPLQVLRKAGAEVGHIAVSRAALIGRVLERLQREQEQQQREQQN